MADNYSPFTFDFSGWLPFEFVPQASQDADLIRQLGFLPGLKEILMVRQVHALEHATVWVLSEWSQSRHLDSDTFLNANPLPKPNTPAGLLGGMSTERGFYLYGSIDTAPVRQAVEAALERMVRGEWHLAVHPNCGTNLSTGLLVTAGLTAGFSLVAPKDPLGQLLGFGAAATLGTWLAPELGSLAQRYVTTAIPFNLAIAQIDTGRDRLGNPYHFVATRWIE